MSYLYPTAEVNSAGEERDPITGPRLDRALGNYERWGKRDKSLDPFNPFSSWKRITEDIIHFTPIDNLPEEERDAIRIRRRENYKNSSVPWIISDYTTLLTAFDDVDDLMKTKTLIKDYAIKPLTKEARAARAARNALEGDKTENWVDACQGKAPPRARKIAVSNLSGLNVLAALGLGALGALFPEWRLASLLFQALQATDSLFGVGIQLGPILGYAMEGFFRGLANTNGPILSFDNKYEQLKAARVMANGNRALAAAQHAHSDDALTSLTGFYYASDADILPQLVIDQEDYPNVSDVFAHPWSPSETGATILKEGFDAARLAVSLPYNMGALAVNNILGDALSGMSEILGGPGATGLGKLAPDNQTAAMMRLAELGICPAGQCPGELAMDTLILSTNGGRIDPKTGEQLTTRELARRLQMNVADPTQQTSTE